MPLQRFRQRLQVILHVVDRVGGVELVFDVVRVEDRVERRVPSPVHRHEYAVAAQANRYPCSDQRPAAEHVVGYLQGDGEDVGASEGVAPGPLEVSCLATDQPVQDALSVGEEGVAALAGEQPARAGLDGRGRGVETHSGGLDEHVTTRFTGLGLAAGRVVGGGGLPAVSEPREGEAERYVRQRVPVGIDVEPVDRIGVEPVAFRERVRVHDQYGPVGVIGSGEYEEVGQVQAGIVAGVLEVGGAEVVRHGYSFGGTCLGGRAAQGISCAGFVAE